MNTLEVVAVLQLVIILLLLEPQRRRRRALGAIIGVGAVCVAIYYLGPSAIGLLYEAVSPIKEKYGWSGLFIFIAVIVYVIALVIAFWIGAKQNREIRAGSKDAFDKRINDLMRDQHYSLEDATAAVVKIRDEKKR